MCVLTPFNQYERISANQLPVINLNADYVNNISTITFHTQIGVTNSLVQEKAQQGPKGKN